MRNYLLRIKADMLNEESDSITVRPGLPDVQSYLRLRRAVGWPIPDNEVVAEALGNTNHGFIAERYGEVVGMATIHGDGALYFYIQDVMVHPDYQRQGVGTGLMDAVMGYVNTKAAPPAYVALFSVKGIEPFYARYGFIERPVDSFGAGMFFIKGIKEGPRPTTE